MKNVKKLLLITSSIFISSCNVFNLIPVTSSANNTIQPVNNANQLKPQMLKFESNLKWQGLETTSELSSGFKVSDSQPLKEIIFSTSGNTKEQVKIPETGSYKLIIEKGDSLAIKDGDATDGQAVISIPEGSYEGYLQTSGKANLKDNLYYVSQEITKQPDNVWYKLGKKKFPVPAEWNNPDGDKYVINIDNLGIKDMKIRWFETQTIDYPLGMKEIGLEGGVIDLPGVGHLSIPEGALDKNTFVKVNQELSAEEVFDIVNPEYGRIEDFASPIVKIEPLGLELKKSATIFLETDKARLGNNDPLTMSWMQSDDKKNWQNIGYIDNNLPVSEYSDSTPSIINKFGYLTKQIPADVKPNEGFVTFKKEKSFSTKTNDPNCNSQNTKTDDEVKEFAPYVDIDPPYIVGGPINSKPITYNCLFNKGNTIFIHYIKDKTSLTSVKNIAERSFQAYIYFARLTKVYPDNVHFYTRTYGTPPNPTYTNTEINKFKLKECVTNTYLKVRIKGEECVEHELWHTFQYANAPFPELGVRGTKIPFKIINYKKWIIEATAEYMGAKAYKIYADKHPNVDLAMKTAYIENLSRSLDNISGIFPYYFDDDAGYKGVGFITYLIYKKTDDQIAQFLFKGIYDEISVAGAYSDFLRDHFHEYALYAFLETHFNIYTPTDYPYNENFLDVPVEKYEILRNIQSNKKIVKESGNESIKGPIPTMSIKYYKIDTSYNPKTAKKLPNGKEILKDLIIEPSSKDNLEGLEIKLLSYSPRNFKEGDFRFDACKPIPSGKYNPNCFLGEPNGKPIYIKKSKGSFNKRRITNFQVNDYAVLIVSNSNQVYSTDFSLKISLDNSIYSF